MTYVKPKHLKLKGSRRSNLAAGETVSRRNERHNDASLSLRLGMGGSLRPIAVRLLSQLFQKTTEIPYYKRLISKRKCKVGAQNDEDCMK